MRRVLDGTRGWIVVGVAFLVVAIAVAGGAYAIGGSHSPSGRTLLNETRHTYANARTVVGTAEIDVRNATSSRSATVQYAEAGNASRVIVRSAGTTYRAGTNGTVRWYAGPNRTRLWTTSPTIGGGGRGAGWQTGPGALANRTRSLARNATVTDRGRTTLNGSEAYVVSITPKNATAKTRRATVWIAASDHRLLRVHAVNGANETTVTFPTTHFDVSVDSSTFQPPGTRALVTETATYGSFAATQAHASLSLPRLNGTFERGAVSTRSNGVVVSQRYRLAGHDVTVVSTTIGGVHSPANATAIRVNGRPARFATAHGRRIVYWQHDGVTTAVVTQTTKAETVRIAGRLAAGG